MQQEMPANVISEFVPSTCLSAQRYVHRYEVDQDGRAGAGGHPSRSDGHAGRPEAGLFLCCSGLYEEDSVASAGMMPPTASRIARINISFFMASVLSRGVLVVKLLVPWVTPSALVGVRRDLAKGG